jgi:Membrane protein involved in the export of O-antigen and teichoic acid
MSLKRTALVTALWSMGESWGMKIVSAGVFLLLARLIEPSAFGLAALAQVYLMAVQTISDQGLTTALIQRETIEEAHKDSAFWANLGVGLALMILTIAFAGPLADLYGEPRLAPVLRWYSLAPLLTSVSVVQIGLARRELRFRDLALRQTASALIGGAVGVAMAFAGMGVWALVGQGSSARRWVVILWAIVAWRPRFAFSRRHFADLFGFGFNVLATNLLRILGGQADRLLLGFYFGATEVGYYSVAQRLVSIITDFVAGSTERAVVPLFSRIQEDPRAGGPRADHGPAPAQPDRDPGLHRPGRHRPLAHPRRRRRPMGAQHPADPHPRLLLLAYCLGFFFGHVVTALGRPTIRLGVVTAQAVTQVGLSLIGVRWGHPGRRRRRGRHPDHLLWP